MRRPGFDGFRQDVIAAREIEIDRVVALPRLRGGPLDGGIAAQLAEAGRYLTPFLASLGGVETPA